MRLGSKFTQGRESKIFDSAGTSPLGNTFGPGSMPGAGTYFCVNCGSQLSLRETDAIPSCPRCGSARFRRDSIFEDHQEHPASTAEIGPPGDERPPSWLPQARRQLSGQGHFLAFRDDGGELAIFPVRRGWTRIGRSASSDVCLDDPTVSRRHALIVAEPGKDLRVLDDRSLNGVFVNGAAVEWGRLRDGDRLTIGRYDLYALDG
ncbi:MAG: FHA domain-containing protein [Solirubrobacterales bacterium]